MNNNILFNSELQYELDNKGYAVFDFLSGDTIKKILKETIISNKDNKVAGYGYKISIHSTDKNYRKKISDLLELILMPHISHHLHSYKLYGISFGNKYPQKNTKVSAHQEWTLVDEEQFRAYTIWVPLVDIDLYNGPLFVLPGSHYGNVFKAIRPINVPYFFNSHENMVKDFSIPLLLKAGEAVIFNQSLIHFSTPNFSKQNRPCVMVSLKDSAAVDNHIYFRNESHILEKYKVDDGFAFDYPDFLDINNIKPVGNLVGYEDFNYNSYSKHETGVIFREMLLKCNYCKNVNQIRKINFNQKMNALKVFFYKFLL